MAVNQNSIFLWRGNVHLGDEPGIYSNASYAGLIIEYPLMVRNIIAAKPKKDVLKLELLTQDVAVFKGYPGHKIIVRQYSPDPTPQNKYHWKGTIIKDTDRIIGKATSTIVEIPIKANFNPTFISIAIEIESDIMPGLYDDFLFTGLNYTIEKKSIYVKFGFEEIN